MDLAWKVSGRRANGWRYRDLFWRLARERRESRECRENRENGGCNWKRKVTRLRRRTGGAQRCRSLPPSCLFRSSAFLSLFFFSLSPRVFLYRFAFARLKPRAERFRGYRKIGKTLGRQRTSNLGVGNSGERIIRLSRKPRTRSYRAYGRRKDREARMKKPVAQGMRLPYNLTRSGRDLHGRDLPSFHLSC